MSARRITVEPMLGFPVIRDLVVDMDPFFAKYEKVKPFLINDEPAPRTERLQSPEQRERYDETTKCILCGACTGSCPSVWANAEWVGPASIVNAHRFIFDSRDRGSAGALADSGRPQRRLALPHDLQLHGGVPAWHPRHRGD